MGWVRSYRTFSPLPRRFAHRNVSFPASGKGHTLCGISSFPSNPLTLGFDGSPLKGKAVSLCCTCPGVTPGGRYPLSLPCGARTFLIWVLSVPIRGCPPRSRIYCTSWGGKSQMSCKFFSKGIYYIVHIGLTQQIGIWRIVRTGHSEPAHRLQWESPSNFRMTIVILRRGAH